MTATDATKEPLQPAILNDSAVADLVPVEIPSPEDEPGAGGTTHH